MTAAQKLDRPRSIALVDLSYLFSKRFHTVASKERNAAAKATLIDLENLKRGVGHVIICRDAPPYKRTAIYEGYKSKRPEKEPEEIAQRKWLHAEIKRLGYNVAWSEGYEADDVMATLAKQYSVWCGDVRLVGPDKDMCQCVTDAVVQYVPPHGNRDWEVRDVKGVREKFGVDPSGMALFQALAGDDSDSIPGIKGIGKVKAAKLVNECGGNLVKLAENMSAAAAFTTPDAVVKALAANWPLLETFLRLTTLATDVPIDGESLLVLRAPEPVAPARNSMDIELDGFVGNETPQPQNTPAPEVRHDTQPSLDEVWTTARKVYDARFVANDRTKNPNDYIDTKETVSGDEPRAVKDAELLEREYDREREQEGEADTTSNQPGQKSAERVAVPQKPRGTVALATTPVVTQHAKYGMVTADLQPIDLTAAYTVSEWLCRSNLYPQFKNEAQIFAIIARGKELGIGMTTALAGHHMLGGKPVASADLIRALAERDKNFEYLMPVEMSATRVVWEGKHKQQPRPVQYTYTIEDAQLAGLAKKGNYGDASNWSKRPQDMLVKTAGSKLARLLWPAACLDLYCAEELGLSEEELDQREAA